MEAVIPDRLSHRYKLLDRHVDVQAEDLYKPKYVSSLIVKWTFDNTAEAIAEVSRVANHPSLSLLQLVLADARVVSEFETQRKHLLEIK